jgi:mannose-6-phosphate isomerase-like protein (cupin superfamily)
MKSLTILPFILAATLTAALTAPAQTTGTVVHTTADLQQREAQLVAKAKASQTGLASEVMDEFGNDRTLMAVRVHSGDPERHQLWADQMVIRKGTLTLITGGTLQGEHPNTTSPGTGEFLGTGIQDGKEVVLHAGDIAHIPAGVPHQVKLAPNTTAVYLVFKEK